MVKKIMLACFVVVAVLLATCASIFFLSFKTDHKDIAEVEGAQNGIETSLVMSIIKAESKFDKNARSSANALGLMQVKLETANYMASLCGEQALVESDLFVPEINIKIGTRYFAYLLNKFENLEVSICAYNAGETVVRDWLNSSEFSADGKTLQKIPYAETQRYLKKVMFNYGVYKKMFK
jgi:soluble lytic murein transglycosylase